MVQDLFTPLLGNLNQLGFYRFFMPWLFTLAIIYGLMLKTKLFDQTEKTMNGVIALVVAFFVVNFTPVGFGLDAFFTQIFGVGILILTAIFVVLLLMGLVGLKGEDIFKAENLKSGGLSIIALIVFMIILLLIVGGVRIDPSQLTLISTLIFIIVAVAYIAK